MTIDHYLIPRELDKRVKIQLEDHEIIKQMHKEGIAMRKIAQVYQVHRRTIQFIISPEKRTANYATRVANGGSKQYYNKDKWKQDMRQFRANKKHLLKTDKLINKDNETQ